MAKIQIISDKLTAFGGIFLVMGKFEQVISPVIDKTLGLRVIFRRNKIKSAHNGCPVACRNVTHASEKALRSDALYIHAEHPGDVGGMTDSMRSRPGRKAAEITPENIFNP